MKVFKLTAELSYEYSFDLCKMLEFLSDQEPEGKFTVEIVKGEEEENESV